MRNELPKTLQDAIVFFSDDQICIDFVAALRWPDGVPVCPNCQGKEHSFLKTRKIWKCKVCKKQFGVKYGTIFEDSPLGLDKWLMAIWMIANCKNGVSSYEIARDLGITQKSGWFMLHRIRLAMQVGSIEKLSGTVEADEAFFGGDAKNMHRSKRIRFESRWTRQVKDHKTAVFGMIQRNGTARARVIKSVRTEDVMPIIQEHIEKNSEVFTDQAVIYRELREAYIHATVNHSIEYVRGNVHTNGIENYWSLLKRTIKGTYVSVAPEHLQRYVEEQTFRFNERKNADNDRGRFIALVASVSGKRITYAQLIDSLPKGH